MIDFLTSGPTFFAIIILTILAVIIGSDNIKFLTLTTTKLEPKQKSSTLNLALVIGLLLRIAFALIAFWTLSLTAPFWNISLPWFNAEISGYTLLLILGGLFLLFKATSEIHEEVEDRGFDERKIKSEQTKDMGKSIWNSTLINIIFSFDVVLLAVGLTNGLNDNKSYILIAIIIALCLSFLLLIVFKNKLQRVFEKHPSIHILGLGLLLLVGFSMVLEGAYISVMQLFGSPIGILPKIYIYVIIAIALILMFINIKIRKENSKGEIIS